MAKRYIPRWLYTEATIVNIPATGSSSIKIPPGTLMNDTIWPMKLEHLVVAGLPIVDNMAVGGLVEGNAGIGDLMFAEIGITQEGSVNAVEATLNGVFSCDHPADLQCFSQHETMTKHFSHPYRLSRDNGFIVRRRTRVDLRSDDGADADKTWIGVVFRGVDIVTGKPVIMGGNNENRISRAVGELTFNSADLLNKGVHDVDIYSVTLDSWEHPDAGMGVLEEYLINPILGERWMPGESEIPSGCIAPYGTMGILNAAGAGNQGFIITHDYGPHTFVFSPGTYLHRRQEVALRLRRSWYALNQPVHVALFGYLEVE